MTTQNYLLLEGEKSMRKVKLSQINENITKNRQYVSKKMNAERNEKLNSNKIRTKSKQDLLLKLTKSTLRNAREQGKFKTTGKRELYYDPN